MTDVLTPKQRSYCMSKNRGSDTKPELILRKALWQEGFRYRLRSKLPGKPDLTFRKHRLVVFVDGCFWHGCPEHYKEPKSSAVFWKNKIDKNIARDQQVNRMLREDGWRVIRLWEHQIKHDLGRCIREISEQIAQT